MYLNSPSFGPRDLGHPGPYLGRRRRRRRRRDRMVLQNRLWEERLTKLFKQCSISRRTPSKIRETSSTSKNHLFLHGGGKHGGNLRGKRRTKEREGIPCRRRRLSSPAAPHNCKQVPVVVALFHLTTETSFGIRAQLDQYRRYSRHQEEGESEKALTFWWER